MANLTPEYSLTEVSRQLRVPDTWVRRWEKILSLQGSSGQQGKKSLYTDEILKIFQRIRVLQIIGLSNEEIRRLWSMELVIKKFDRREVAGKRGERFFYALRLAQPEKAVLLYAADFEGHPELKELLQRHYDYYQKHITNAYAYTKELIDNFAYVARGTSKIDIGFSDYEHAREILGKLGVNVGVPISHDEFEINNGPNS
jgi:DNA-binding transcriptional MerR regulator